MMLKVLSSRLAIPTAASYASSQSMVMKMRAPFKMNMSAPQQNLFLPFQYAGFATAKKPKTPKEPKEPKTPRKTTAKKSKIADPVVQAQTEEEIPSPSTTPADTENAKATLDSVEVEQPDKEVEKKPVVESKMFGKIKIRPSKGEFEEELLDSDFNNLTKSF